MAPFFREMSKKVSEPSAQQQLKNDHDPVKNRKIRPKALKLIHSSKKNMTKIMGLHMVYIHFWGAAPPESLAPWLSRPPPRRPVPAHAPAAAAPDGLWPSWAFAVVTSTSFGHLLGGWFCWSKKAQDLLHFWWSFCCPIFWGNHIGTLLKWRFAESLLDGNYSKTDC